jgi:hypothetical protein
MGGEVNHTSPFDHHDVVANSWTISVNNAQVISVPEHASFSQYPDGYALKNGNRRAIQYNE